MFINWVQDLLRASATIVDSVYHHFLFPFLEKQGIADVALKQCNWFPESLGTSLCMFALVGRIVSVNQWFSALDTHWNHLRS